MRKFTKTMAAVLSLTMTLTMVTPVFAEGETNITPAQTTEVVTKSKRSITASTKKVLLL